MIDNKNEEFPIVDEMGNILGAVTRGHAHDGSKILHPVVHLHVFNSRGDLYLQHRPAWKDIQPDKWDTACGGHVDLGESVSQALHREVREELGITDFEPESLGHYVFESQREKELVYVHRCVYDGEVKPSQEELAGGRFWTKDEISENIGKGVFTKKKKNAPRLFFFRGGGRIFLYVGTQQMLRRDVFSAGSWPVSDRIGRSVKSRRYP